MSSGPRLAKWIFLLSTMLVGLPPLAAAAPWPGEPWGSSTNLTSLNPTGWATNLSGAYWNPTTRRLWVCTNGPAKFWSLAENGSGGFLLEREYTGTGDLEGITQIGSAPDRVFLLDERARTIRSYRVSDGVAMATWFLSTIPDWDNSGPEGLAFVPNAWLAQNQFVDGSGAPYPQSVHGADGFGGIVFVAVQTSGWVYAFDLKTDGTFTFVGRYLTSRTESCEMTFDASVGRMYVLHNTGGNWLEITNLTSTVAGSDRRLNLLADVQVPSSSNIEGFALTPALTEAGAVGDNWCFFTDDDNAAGALRWFRQLSSRLSKHGGDGQTADAGSAVPIPPSARAEDPFSNPLPGFPVTFALTSGGGSTIGEEATTSAAGVASVGEWSLGPSPGVNTLTASGAGLSGSPVTFTATSVQGPVSVPDALVSDGIQLGAPTPNPGREEVSISFTLPRSAAASLVVFDVRGRLVKTLTSGVFPGGVHGAVWDGRSADGTPAEPGVYFYRLQIGDEVLSRQGLLLR